MDIIAYIAYRDVSLSHGVALFLFGYRVKDWKQSILDVVITLSVCRVLVRFV